MPWNLEVRVKMFLLGWWVVGVCSLGVEIMDWQQKKKECKRTDIKEMAG